MGDEKEIREKYAWMMKIAKNINSYLVIAGFILAAVGVIGTYYQILGSKIAWISLIVLGFAIPLALLFLYIKGNHSPLGSSHASNLPLR